MEPIVGASRTSDSVDYWHYTHSKSTCWKRSMTTTSFHSSKLLRMHIAMSAGTTWRNTRRITGKFIRKTMTKLKLFNYQSHPVLHAGIARTSRKRLCFLSSLRCVMFRFSHTAICSMLYGYSGTFFSITSTGHLKGDRWGEREIDDLLEICCNAVRTDTDYHFWILRIVS